MKVLVISASKHGSTEEIGQAIADELRTPSATVDVKRVAEPVQLDEYDGIVLGSAVYMGKWLPEAMAFVEANQRILFEKPLWLFSSGPLGDPPKGSLDEHETVKLVAETAALDHKIFTGSLDPEELGFKERLVVKMVKGPTGDFRNWEDIRAWAGLINDTLTARTDSSPTA